MKRTSGPSPRVRQFLSDNKWHSREEIVGKIGPIIKPEIAVRTYRHKTRNGKGPLRNGIENAVKFGRKWYIERLMLHLVANGEVAVKVDDGITFYQLKPVPPIDLLRLARVVIRNSKCNKKKEAMELLTLVIERLNSDDNKKTT